jgi:hypothetical protein
LLWPGTFLWKEPKRFRSVVKESLGVQTMISGSLSPRHGASSDCGWRNGFQIWRVAADILSSSRGQLTESGPRGLGQVLTTPHHQNVTRYETFHKSSYLDWSFGTTRDSSPGMWGVCLDRGGKSLERVKQFKYFERNQQMKISFVRELRACWNLGMLAIIRCRICRLPACYPKI